MMQHFDERSWCRDYDQIKQNVLAKRARGTLCQPEDVRELGVLVAVLEKGLATMQASPMSFEVTQSGAFVPPKCRLVLFFFAPTVPSTPQPLMPCSLSHTISIAPHCFQSPRPLPPRRAVPPRSHHREPQKTAGDAQRCGRRNVSRRRTPLGRNPRPQLLLLLLLFLPWLWLDLLRDAESPCAKCSERQGPGAEAGGRDAAAGPSDCRHCLGRGPPAPKR